MVTSKKAAQIFWTKPSEYHRATAIRADSKEYLKFGSPTPHQQRKYVKIVLLFSDEDIGAAAKGWINASRMQRLYLSYFARDVKHSSSSTNPATITHTLKMHDWPPDSI
ncbi:hypothetical protein DFQ30_003245 [Apophysomyces sp. BC1015]|nr:hypothetical protein DFQ30_003245 [Apophysomyces sp. BC1015]